MTSTIPENVAIKVKISKPRSKKAEKGPIVEQNTPTIPNTGPILETTAPINGMKEAIVDKCVENTIVAPIIDLEMGICDNSQIIENDVEPLKKRRGRPAGCLDKVKRRSKGEVLKPPVQHGKLGRPQGSLDKAPRQKRAPKTVQNTDLSSLTEFGNLNLEP
jgi:hypothetical protein